MKIRLEQIFNKSSKENNALIFMELGPKCEDIQNLSVSYLETQTNVILKFIMKGEVDCACRKALELCDMISANENAEEVCKAFEYYRLAFIDTLKTYNLNRSPEEFSFLPEPPEPLQMNQSMKRFCTSAAEHLAEIYRSDARTV